MSAGRMQIGNLYIDPQQALEVLGAVGGVGLTTLFGLLLVRRARATRRRQIEGLENDGPVKEKPRRRLRAEDLAPDEPESEAVEEPAVGAADSGGEAEVEAAPVPELPPRPASPGRPSHPE